MTDANKVTILPRTSHAMGGALSAYANGASVEAAAQAHGVSVAALYRAARKHNVRASERCPTCGRLNPKATSRAEVETPGSS